MSRPDPRHEPIYLGILIALGLTVAAAVLLAVLGGTVWDSPALRLGGTLIAVVAAAIYAAFRVWGRRRANAGR